MLYGRTRVEAGRPGVEEGEFPPELHRPRGEALKGDERLIKGGELELASCRNTLTESSVERICGICGKRDKRGEDGGTLRGDARRLDERARQRRSDGA